LEREVLVVSWQHFVADQQLPVFVLDLQPLLHLVNSNFETLDEDLAQNLAKNRSVNDKVKSGSWQRFEFKK